MKTIANSIQFWNETVVSKHINNFKERSDQNTLIEKIKKAIETEKTILILEAGTGIGKSFAYLIPILNSYYKCNNEYERKECRSIISTNNIVLQNQIYFKDLPLITKIIKESSGKKYEPETQLLFGRNNYLCKKHFGERSLDEISLTTKESQKEYETIKKYLKKNSHLCEITFDNIGIKTPDIINEFSCSKKFCKECDEQCIFNGDDYLRKNVMVTNHSYIMQQYKSFKKNVKGRSFGIGTKFNKINESPLKDKIVIFDEAHKLEDAIMSANHVEYNIHNIYTRIRAYVSLSSIAQPKVLDNIFEYIIGTCPIPKEQISELILKSVEIKKLIIDYKSYYDRIDKTKLNINEYIKDSNCYFHNEIMDFLEYTSKIMLRVTSVLETYSGILRDYNNNNTNKNYKQTLSDVFFTKKHSSEYSEFLKNFMTIKNKKTIRYIIKKNEKDIYVGFNDLEIDYEIFSRYLKPAKCVVFLSATLSTNKNFEYFRNLLGINEKNYIETNIDEGIYLSPFDYESNMKMYINENGHDDIDDLIKLLSTHDDGALLLFTSNSEMKKYYDAINPVLKKDNVYMQGLVPKKKILEIAKAEKTIIFATASFWEGIDLQGDHLNLLYINKLPFDNPTEIFIEKKISILKDDGIDAFKEYSIPRAVMKFKQGIGRLIRTETDKGIVLIKDNRIIYSKYYSHFFAKEFPVKPILYTDINEIILDK